MSVPALGDWLASEPRALRKGPLAILLIEDEVEIASTIAHLLRLGFPTILALAPDDITVPAAERVVPLRFDTRRRDSHTRAVNAVIDAAPPDTWLHYGYNAEYLFTPFADTRRVTEALTFHAEERRRAMLTYVIDLYAEDLQAHPNGVDLPTAMFDRSGYYALARRDRDGNVLERQLDFHGGLRWRFEEYLPAERLRIDRVSLFRTTPGLTLLEDHRLDVEELNTYACPWHNSLTGAVASFRVAKALRHNPRSRAAVQTMAWGSSVRFDWTAMQLMEAGLMEPGQWF